MDTKIKLGSLAEFFTSAKETTKELDSGKNITPKNTAWIDDKVKFDAVLAKIKSTEPDEQDKL